MNLKQIDDIIYFCEEYNVDHEVIEEYQGSRSHGRATAAIQIPARDKNGDAQLLNELLTENLGFRRDWSDPFWIWY
jgi:hypothetical protein